MALKTVPAKIERPALVRVGAQGRVVIPASVRKALGLKAGDSLVARVGDGRLVLERPEEETKRREAWTRLQELFAHIPPGVSLADELIAERRAEAEPVSGTSP